MAHMIAKTADGRDAFVAAKIPGWHKLGTVLPDRFTAEEAIRYAGMDFPIEKHPLHVHLPDTDGIGVDCIGVPKGFATVRMDTRQPLGVVGKDYTILQNKDAFGFFDAVVDEGEAVYETAGMLDGGRRIWIMAKMPDYISMPGDDKIEQYVVIMNSHDGSSAVVAFLTQVRVVCWNTLSYAIRGAKNKVSVRHTSSVKQNVEQAHKVLGITNQLKIQLEESYRHMASKKVRGQYIDELLKTLLPDPEHNYMRNVNKPKREAIMESLETAPGQDILETYGTAYWLYNGITHWTDHVRKHKDDSAQLNSIWTGPVADFKTKAAELILSGN